MDNNIVIGITVILAGVLILFDYFLRDKERNDPKNKKEELLKKVDYNKHVLAIFEKYDKDKTLRDSKDVVKDRAYRKLATLLLNNPDADLEEELKNYIDEFRSREDIIKGTMITLYQLYNRKIQRGDKTSLLKSIYLFISSFFVYFGLLLIMWGVALVFL